jgi:hypothetical protein
MSTFMHDYAKGMLARCYYYPSHDIGWPLPDPHSRAHGGGNDQPVCSDVAHCPHRAKYGQAADLLGDSRAVNVADGSNVFCR